MEPAFVLAILLWDTERKPIDQKQALQDDSWNWIFVGLFWKQIHAELYVQILSWGALGLCFCGFPAWPWPTYSLLVWDSSTMRSEIQSRMLLTQAFAFLSTLSTVCGPLVCKSWCVTGEIFHVDTGSCYTKQCIFLKISIYLKGKATEWKRQKDLPSVVSLPKWSQHPGLGQAKSKSQDTRVAGI